MTVISSIPLNPPFADYVALQRSTVGESGRYFFGQQCIPLLVSRMAERITSSGNNPLPHNSPKNSLPPRASVGTMAGFSRSRSSIKRMSELYIPPSLKHTFTISSQRKGLFQILGNTLENMDSNTFGVKFHGQAFIQRKWLPSIPPCANLAQHRHHAPS